MNAPDSLSDDVIDGPNTFQSLFMGEKLHIPPLPEHLAACLQRQGKTLFATKPLRATPYDLARFLEEVETDPETPAYAVVGFDGHGINSWAAHCYVVSDAIALFIQLPWGGAYLDPDLARAEIADMFDWAATLLPKVQSASEQQKIPNGLRLQVVASRFGRAGWRWLAAGADNGAVEWNPAGGMKATILKTVDEILSGKQVL